MKPNLFTMYPDYRINNIETYLLKVRLAETEETAIAGQWLRKHVSMKPNHMTATTDTQQ
jgi:hypothetical protein